MLLHYAVKNTHARIGAPGVTRREIEDSIRIGRLMPLFDDRGHFITLASTKL